VFPYDAVFARAEQPGYVHGEASITSDTRDSRSRPASGGVYRAGWTAYADRDGGAFSFRRYEAEAAQFIPLAARRVVLALHGWIVGSETRADTQIPFYLMPSLGGGNTLRAYSDYRFHDRNLLLVTAESRVALLKHLDLAAFVDAGNVAPRMSGLDLDKKSYGIGFRMHTDRATFARLDVAHGDEGWRILFRTSDPFHLTRLSRRTAAAPFVP
jgi:outer membrane protein assembly factor BamA